MENTSIENTEDVIEDINEETLLSLDENLELDQEVAEISEAKCKKEGEDEEESESDEEESCDSEKEDDEEEEEEEGEEEEEEQMNEAEYPEMNDNDKRVAKDVDDHFKKIRRSRNTTFYSIGVDRYEETRKKLVDKYGPNWRQKAGIIKGKVKEEKEMNEAKKIVEAEVNSDEEFTEYAQGVLKSAHGENYDEKKAMETIEGILKKADGDYGAAVGMLTSGLGEESDEEEMMEDTDITIDSSDITRLVESEEGLTEEFKEKATTIFEAALKSKLKETEETLKESYAVALIEEVEAIKEELVDKIDSYLTYAVESWAADNAVAIESGLRTEIAENFIQSLKTVFVENYIEVPEAKKDLVAEMEEQVATLQAEAAVTSETVAALNEQVERLTREKILAEASSDLADTQAAKLQSLVEDVVYTSETSYRKKVETIKEFYLKGVLEEETETLQESNDDSYITTETIVENESLQEETVSPAMQKYLTALSRLNKANEATVPVQ